MRRNETDSSSSPNWRAPKKDEISQNQRSFKNFSSCRTYSDKNSLRNYDSTTDGNRRSSNYPNRQRPTSESNWRLREGESSDNCCKSDTTSYEGSWVFRVDDEEKELFLEVLEKLHEDNPSLFVNPPSLGKKKHGVTSIMCPTADWRDEDSVRNVARIINNVVDHPYCVYYYYKFSPIYLFLKNAFFKSVKRDNTIAWIAMKDKTPSSITDQVKDISLDDNDDDSSANLPSKVTDSMCLFYPSESTVENLPSRAGKWMLYGAKDMAKMDAYWKKLKLLCDKGVLAALKSSTAADERGGVIRAYTNDCENMEEVNLAGNAILEETEYNEPLFYKTNEASKKGAYIHEGKQSVSLYLHVGKPRMCFKDKHLRWKLWQTM